MTITKVALVGANGNLGPSILSALLSANTFDVTVLSRDSSKSTYPYTVHDVRIPDEPSVEDLTRTLKGQDAVVIAFAGSNSDLQILFADAAAAAGVKRVIPADFGSCDSSSPRALELVPLYRAKQKVRHHLQALAKSGSLSWTSLVCGHFFDHGLETPLLSFDIHKRKARIFDDGDVRWSTTTLKTIGLAVVRILQKEVETKNRMLYIQSFCVSQNQVLQLCEQFSEQKWDVEHVSSEDFIKVKRAALDQSPKDGELTEQLVSVVGIVDANWEAKEDFAVELLGLEPEDLHETVKQIIKAA